MIDGWDTCCKIALRRMSLDLTDDKSTLVQVMAWCRQATSYYLSQCWPRSLMPYGITRPQRVNVPSNLWYKAHQIMKLLYSSCSCLCSIQWGQVLSREWRCCWSCADRSLLNPLRPGVKSRVKMLLELRGQAMLQLHLSDQQFYCLITYV